MLLLVLTLELLLVLTLVLMLVLLLVLMLLLVLTLVLLLMLMLLLILVLLMLMLLLVLVLILLLMKDIEPLAGQDLKKGLSSPQASPSWPRRQTPRRGEHRRLLCQRDSAHTTGEMTNLINDDVNASLLRC